MQFKNAMIYTEQFRFQHGAFSVEDGKFAGVLAQPGADAVDLEGAYVIPGLIDVHTHGNSGADLSDGDLEGLTRMAAYSARCGITSFAPTTLTLPYETLAKAFAAARRLGGLPARGRRSGARRPHGGPGFSVRKRKARKTEPICAIRTLRPFSGSMKTAAA